MSEKEMIKRKTWKEFRDIGMLWWVNRILHLFGWAICFDFDGSELKEVYPARCHFRGFDSDSETEGFKKVSEYLDSNIEDLLKDCE